MRRCVFSERPRETPGKARFRSWICFSLCSQRRFYGPRERKMGLLGFLRVGVWMNGLRAFRSGFMGNVLGEGFVLGGVFVIGREQQVKPVPLWQVSVLRLSKTRCSCSLPGNTSGAQRARIWR